MFVRASICLSLTRASRRVGVTLAIRSRHFTRDVRYYLSLIAAGNDSVRQVGIIESIRVADYFDTFFI